MAFRKLLCLFGFYFMVSPASAAQIDGAQLSAVWGLPFAGLLLTIAFVPQFAPRLWHKHLGMLSDGWSLLLLIPLTWTFGWAAMLGLVTHAIVLEFIPFIIILLTLYTVAGGLFVRGNLHGSPLTNLGLLALGTALASVIGTTGAAMVLIRPLIRANDTRKFSVHVIIFFIFLVANIGGALTPLGDPPLFLGYLNGVSFFWTTTHLFEEMLLCVAMLLTVFFIIDSYLFKKHGAAQLDPTPDTGGVTLIGKANLALLVLIILIVLGSAQADLGRFTLAGSEIKIAAILRDMLLIVITLVSLAITPGAARKGNQFTWAPMAEVTKIFGAVFVTIAPVILMLQAGTQGALSFLTQAVQDTNGAPSAAHYFWFTGLLSGFLDNAPTYLVFFNLAGGNAAQLMGEMSPILAAISCGAVFMGALTYIGNAPNLMVKTIAEQNGVAMPGFFGFMIWSCVILLPLFAAVSFIFFN